ncbi:MAG TPA: TlpA family protein disulfide reductase [Rhodospirillales bacterium]|nr:TlpA family protein disulfide reductase [Rhodospirillales bacterium]
MKISTIFDRYIPQGQCPCKSFSRKMAVFLGILLAIPVIVAISRPVASAETDKCRNPGPALNRFVPALPPRPVTQRPFFDVTGAPLTLAKYQGRGLVLNFWATWCIPCVRELPALAQLRKNLSTQGVEVIALSIDRGGVPVVRKFMAKIGIDNLAILIDVKGKVSRKSRVRGLPSTILIDADGIERGRVVGYTEWDTDDAAEFIRRCIGRQ